MWYALYGKKTPIYMTDENGDIVHMDIDGQQVPVESGEYEIGYEQPVMFKGNISESGGESEAKAFGIDVSEYDAVIVLNKGEIPVSETSLIWHQSKIQYKDEEHTIVDEKSADYTVKRVSNSLNGTKVLLKRIVK